jgi:NAD(P)-dependent dehydrogenase (short-subunit alcohol dehydrogenase family)
VSTIVIVGAGPGLGLAIAQVFGHKGFKVALIARNQQKLDNLADRLTRESIDAAGFAADIMDPSSVEAAFRRIGERLGPIEILEYSPTPRPQALGAGNVDAVHLTMENLRPQIDFYLGGAINAVRQVLPRMLENDKGTLIFTTGLSSVQPSGMLADVSIAGAGLRNWAHGLHFALADTAVHSAHVAIGVAIGGATGAEATDIAPLYWDIYTQRDQVELLYT